VREVLEGKRVVVVDDSLVRGTTSQGLVKLLREAGRPPRSTSGSRRRRCAPLLLRHRHADAEELIASRLTTEQIRDYLRVDSLGYLSQEGMLEAAGGGEFCTACFSGEYKAPLIDAEHGHAMSSHC
jgi:amidophosphoribosyltransferase